MTKLYSLLALVFVVVGCASGGASSSKTKSHVALSNPTVVKKELVQQLAQWKGTPYQLGGYSKKGIDCSGFVKTTFNDRFGIQLPRSTTSQTSQGVKIAKKDLKPGDLVFFKTNWRGGTGLHVGVYEGNNQFIHASTRRGVIRSSLNEDYWKKSFWQARRLQS